jgi:hypothetical protein
MFLSVDVGTFFLMLFAAGFVLALIALPIFGLFHLYKWAAKKGYWKTGLAVVVAIVGYAAYSMYTGIYPTDDFYLSEFELVTLREAPKSAIRSIQVPMSPWRGPLFTQDRAYMYGSVTPHGSCNSNLRGMALRLSFCPYRLLFKHPFAIAHGVRDGTDSIFIRLEQEGVVGHGEVTLPPYLEEKPEHVVRRLWHVAAAGLDSVEQLLAHVQQEELWPGHQGCRAGLHTACMDWLGKKLNVPVNELLDIRTLKLPMTLVTIGITPMEELAEKLLELPNSDALKVKVDGPGSLPMLLAVLGTDPRPILVDANQGLGRVEDAHALAETVGSRLLGMEQPFGREETGLQRRLQSEAEFPYLRAAQSAKLLSVHRIHRPGAFQSGSLHAGHRGLFLNTHFCVSMAQ